MILRICEIAFIIVIMEILERVAIAFAKYGINSIGQTGMSVL